MEEQQRRMKSEFVPKYGYIDLFVGGAILWKGIV